MSNQFFVAAKKKEETKSQKRKDFQAHTLLSLNTYIYNHRRFVVINNGNAY